MRAMRAVHDVSDDAGDDVTRLVLVLDRIYAFKGQCIKLLQQTRREFHRNSIFMQLLLCRIQTQI